MQNRRIALVSALVGALVLASPPAFAAQYTPPAGPTFNSAVGNAGAQQAINNKIIRTIRSSPRGSHIRIMSWNFQSPTATQALLAAQRRGVRVHVLMARGNAGNNASFNQLRSGLRSGNRPARPHSWARTCRQSCRGNAGAAHSKFYLFSRAGRARNVVIQGSANLTTAAAGNQWNDVVTTRSPGPYNFMATVFGQMAQDRPVKQRYVNRRFGTDRIAFFPGGTQASNDPVMQLLNGVRCTGATNTNTKRTRIRILPNTMRGARGMRLARKVRALYGQGCDIRLGYTVMGIDVGRVLRQPTGRGRVPLVHMVRDQNGDGKFDDYFHMKAMTIIGNQGGKRNQRLVLNGSANWSQEAAFSDENLAVYYRGAMTGRYQEHINFWLNRMQTSNRQSAESGLRRESSNARVTPDGLLFGTGPVDGVDPYANLESD